MNLKINSGHIALLVNDKFCFSDFIIWNEPQKIAIVEDKSRLKVVDIGNIEALVINNERIIYFLSKVFYISKLS